MQIPVDSPDRNESGSCDLSVLSTLSESNAAVSVPRLLLPLIFKRRREQLVSTETMRQSLSWSSVVQAGYGGDDGQQITDLYELLVNHLQVRVCRDCDDDAALCCCSVRGVGPYGCYVAWTDVSSIRHARSLFCSTRR